MNRAEQTDLPPEPFIDEAVVDGGALGYGPNGEFVGGSGSKEVGCRRQKQIFTLLPCSSPAPL